MCRIFGHFGTQVSALQLAAVGGRQLSGGPDAQTLVRGADWSLGCNRLAVTDPSGGAQPYRSGGDGGITVVFNGEIYNHRELRRRLTARGHVFADDCDGSVLPALYAVYGPEFAEQLDGMYAIAVVDLRAEPTLLLAVDPIGMKPLYYHWDPARGALCFASELPALLAFPGVSSTPWEPGLDACLTTRTPLGEQTMFRDVRALPPGALARLTRADGLRSTRRTGEPASDVGTFAEAAGTARRLLAHEVARLSRADVPVCVITSGGLDSGLVTALAAGHLPELHSFNLSYRGSWPSDERAFARETAEYCGATYHQVEVDPATFPDLLPAVVDHLGQPNADPITLSSYALFRAVREAGFTVALTGDGADELFGGYDRMAAAVRTPVGQPWIPAYLDALAVAPRQLREWLYTDDYRAFVASDPEGSTEQRLAAELGKGDRMPALTRFETGSRLPGYHLRRVDHLSMAWGVEARLPYCQPSVAGHARSLPDRFKISEGAVKRTLHGAAAGLLPSSVLARPKQPFTLPVTAMLASGQPLMDFACEVLSPQALRRGGRLEPRRVVELLERQRTVPDHRTALVLWALLIHQLWEDRCRAAAGPARTAR
ncbi:asparagine synthase (glutamine-hydrolyzing) [Kitasatospora sp. GP82]|uniref:asparagine synthase (glutamine-hydrolyzing) n=1 Tax=Kitasatospora sp. GP82 TaxID=3035089 RepID=UPI0024755204|nr:asparagine synthase (glutamine-hydrolyzing) [Kitasatospora sp. GP82]MDH6125712.1 asparagine synthase (glutamine-hydrolyzing) [Kitasatospora sp. GP82]